MSKGSKKSSLIIFAIYPIWRALDFCAVWVTRARPRMCLSYIAHVKNHRHLTGLPCTVLLSWEVRAHHARCGLVGDRHAREVIWVGWLGGQWGGVSGGDRCLVGSTCHFFSAILRARVWAGRAVHGKCQASARRAWQEEGGWGRARRNCLAS